MGKASRDKGARGENEAAKAIMANTALLADRNARNGKADTDVRVWSSKDGKLMHRVEVKRVEGLSLGSKQMEKFRQQAAKDGALCILHRKNRGAWMLDYPQQFRQARLCWEAWVTVTGPDVWTVLAWLVAEADER